MMRKYKTLKGDTWRDIAICYYRVHDAQGNVKESRARRVINALKKRNPQIPSGIPLPEGETINLPSILGIPARDPVKINIPWRSTRYFLLWLVPIIAWTAVAFTQPLWAPLVGQWLQTLPYDLGHVLPIGLPLDWEPAYGLERSFQVLDQPLVRSFQWITVWSLLVFLLWLYGLRSPERPYLQTRIRYLLLWVVGSIVLIAWSGTMIRAILPRAVSQLTKFTSLGPLLAIWSTVVFLLFVYMGDGSNTYRSYLGQYQGIWTSLVLVIVVMFLTGYFAYQGVCECVVGLLAVRTLAGDTVEELPQWTARTETSSRELLSYVLRYGTSSDGEDRDSRTKLLDRLSNDMLPEVEFYATGAHTKARAGLAQISQAIESEEGGDNTDGEAIGISLIQTQRVISAVVESTTAVMSTLDEIDAEIGRLREDPTGSLTDLTTIIGSGLRVSADAANDGAGVVHRTLVAIRVTALATFLWIGAFYSIFVLFPWMLLLLFLFRKRDDRAAQILDDLKLLDPGEKLLERILPSGRPRQPEDVINELASRAFSNFEYVLSLILLSVITAVGWYYFFYPQANSGVALLIRKDGSGITELAEYLVKNISPLTLGFAGAYFYLMQMLLRRYLAADLYPSAFLQAAERLLRVFILSLVLSILAPLANWMPAVTAVIAFLAGIYPKAGLRRVTTLINRLGKSDFPETIETAPLTQLDGLNIWNEARLLEENVENVEGMATAPIEQLVLKTHFPTTQIVDWVDQAILYLHAGHRGEWFPPLRTTGIRTATDLLDATGFNLLEAEALRDHADFIPDLQSLNRIVAAVNAAQAWEISTQEDPREVARIAAAIFLHSAVSTADIASRVHTLAQTIEKEKQETYDYIFALKQKVAAALEATKDASVSGISIAEAGEQLLGENDQKTKAKRATDKIRKAMDRVVPLAEEVGQWTQPMALKPDTLTKLDEVREQTDAWLAELTSTGTQIQVLIDLAITVAEVEETKANANVFLEKAPAARAVLTAAQEATKGARDQVQNLDREHPETLDALQKLKIDLAQLQELSGKLIDEHAEVDRAAKAISMAGAWKSAVTSALNKAAKIVDILQKTAIQARDAAQPLTADDISTLEGLSQSQTAIQQVYEVSQEAQSTIEATVAAVQTASAPPQLTVDILYEICDSVWPDQNMPYILNFYNQLGERLMAPRS